jgi:hypothetical protein
MRGALAVNGSGANPKTPPFHGSIRPAFHPLAAPPILGDPFRSCRRKKFFRDFHLLTVRIDKGAEEFGQDTKKLMAVWRG